MFNLFRKKGADVPSVLPFQTDIHSHILPGIDDGSPDIYTSLELVKGIRALGIRKTVATPHIIGDMFRNTPETIGVALAALKAACEKEAVDIEISAAAEYMLDDYFLMLLNSDAPLLAIDQNIILTEQSFASPTGNLHEISFEIMKKGYKAIMAHPERYHYYHNNYEQYTRLKDMGFLLQINVLSLVGYYGKPAAKAAKYIFDNDLADLVGTDMHHYRHLAALKSEETLAVLYQYLEKRAYNVFDEL